MKIAVQKLMSQGFMVKAPQWSDRLWSVIFCVIDYSTDQNSPFSHSKRYNLGVRARMGTFNSANDYLHLP